MPSKTFRRALTTAACALALSFGLGSIAKAALIPFTWDPSATGDSTVGAFTANTFQVGDYASITVPTNPSPPGSVHETGFLLPSFFFLNGVQTAVANTKGGFGMYESYTTTSHLTGSGNHLTGSFDSVSAQLYIYSTATGVASVTFSGGLPVLALPSGANPLLLATLTGPDNNFVNTAGIDFGVPHADLTSYFHVNPLEASFFVSPSPTLTLALEQSFTNTVGVITKTCNASGCLYEIKNGGGNANFIPEPGTLAVLGMGLACLGFVRRRKSA